MKALMITLLLILLTALGTGAQNKDVLYPLHDTRVDSTHPIWWGNIANPNVGAALDTIPDTLYTVRGDSLFQRERVVQVLWGNYVEWPTMSRMREVYLDPIGIVYRFIGLIQPADTVIYRTLVERQETRREWR
jgi:hypothetical protein